MKINAHKITQMAITIKIKDQIIIDGERIKK